MKKMLFHFAIVLIVAVAFDTAWSLFVGNAFTSHASPMRTHAKLSDNSDNGSSGNNSSGDPQAQSNCPAAIPGTTCNIASGLNDTNTSCSSTPQGPCVLMMQNVKSFCTGTTTKSTNGVKFTDLVWHKPSNPGETVGDILITDIGCATKAPGSTDPSSCTKNTAQNTLCADYIALEKGSNYPITFADVCNFVTRGQAKKARQQLDPSIQCYK
jgi:hypothetical protein